MSSNTDDVNAPISAEPTKTFFVEMLVRDIPLETAILDLVDNSVDGAKQTFGNKRFEGCSVAIEFSKQRFRMIDTCGGFNRQVARLYAFRFGRPKEAPKTAHSIGQFGVGMKRALFKMGHHFLVRSATKEEAWAVDVDVEKWEGQPGWQFPWAKFENTQLSQKKPGTEIIVEKLRSEVAAKFGTEKFVNDIIGLIKSKHRQFIVNGLSISVNGRHVDASDLFLLVSQDGSLQPGVDDLKFDRGGRAAVLVRIIVGIGTSLPRQAGWYVICNGRVILEADRSEITGWGLLEESAGRVYVPSFHNQFARFRGIVSFDSDDSSRVPWNTTKNGVDQDSAIWQSTFVRMMEMMRPVIDFLNELDADIDEHTRDESPMLDYLKKGDAVRADTFVEKKAFKAPTRATAAKRGPRTVKVQYAKPVREVEFLKEALEVNSARAVGERTFELVLKRQQQRSK
ncbi:ATP-binding protein [Bradyrhizobium sp. AUGA SZCCT0176]|uniref:ATP-binding protein n=1 Tax=Bradyrhizobium sp. AUGA SZCCT0176 TaxID=2807664 RepID=UPI001BA77BE0|nr:ATP-binding protein [Bradyrhizobium sp. AUGA SZCCT0176]MBR1226896.1 ATP-binding protein [Bradyrhizobium sp. AUGA SZCCT0176]